MNFYNKCHINNNINKKIGPEDFICLGILGHGSFGEVFLVNKKIPKNISQ